MNITVELVGGPLDGQKIDFDKKMVPPELNFPVAIHPDPFAPPKWPPEPVKRISYARLNKTKYEYLGTK